MGVTSSGSGGGDADENYLPRWLGLATTNFRKSTKAAVRRRSSSWRAMRSVIPNGSTKPSPSSRNGLKPLALTALAAVLKSDAKGHEMGKPKKSDGAPKAFVLSKDAINRVNLGQAFAEYDPVLAKEGVFVRTPAVVAAQDASRAKCFFVGRRGTGKTAITFYLGSKSKNVIQIHPELFATLGTVLDVEDVRDVKQQPFHSLVAIFRRAMLDEVLSEWVRRHLIDYGKFPDKLRSERNWLENYDFDTRVLALVEESEAARKQNDDRAWLKSRGRAKEIAVMMNEMREGPAWDLILLIDRIDDTWNGSDLAVVLLMAMMHACVELAAQSTLVHPLLFLRENLFQRVGQIDAEFARLETAVVSLDWTKDCSLK